MEDLIPFLIFIVFTIFSLLRGRARQKEEREAEEARQRQQREAMQHEATADEEVVEIWEESESTGHFEKMMREGQKPRHSSPFEPVETEPEQPTKRGSQSPDVQKQEDPVKRMLEEVMEPYRRQQQSKPAVSRPAVKMQKRPAFGPDEFRPGMSFDEYVAKVRRSTSHRISAEFNEISVEKYQTARSTRKKQIHFDLRQAVINDAILNPPYLRHLKYY